MIYNHFWQVMKINKNFLFYKILATWLLLFCLTNLISYIPYLGVAVRDKFLRSQYKEDFGQVSLIRCIKNNQNPSYESLINQCNVDKYFWFFKDESLLQEYAIKVFDVDDYSRKMFKVFGNKNKYKSLK